MFIKRNVWNDLSVLLGGIECQPLKHKRLTVIIATMLSVGGEGKDIVVDL